MSKAFTKESDGGGDEAPPPYVPPWPAGARTHHRVEGYARLGAEREGLVARAPSSLGPEERRRLQVIAVHLEAAEIVAPPVGPIERVRFGTTVKVRGERERSYAIVGVDEVDVGRGRIAWLSPMARALTGRGVGDEVVVRTPGGEEELVVLELAPLGPEP